MSVKTITIRMNKEEISGVYIIKNKVNGKFYIGSSIEINDRFYDHKRTLKYGNHHSIKLQRAYSKYGKENFSFEILEEMNFEKPYDKFAVSKVLECREQYFLNTLLFANEKNNKFDKLGYNVCRIAGRTLGLKRSDEAKEKSSITMKKMWMDDSYKNKMSKALMGANNGNTREGLARFNVLVKSLPVVQYDKKGNFIQEFNSVREAGRYQNCSPSNISRACKMQIKTSQGYIWRFKTDATNSNIIINKKSILHSSSRSILQFDKNKKFIREWDVINDAGKTLHIHVGDIVNVCSGNRKSAGGYIWEYKTEKAPI